MAMNIYQRINEVRKRVEYIKKDSTVSGGGSYKAVSHDAVTGALRAALVEHGVIVIPSLLGSAVKDSGSTTGKGVPFIRYEAEYDVRFVDMDDPESFFSMRVESHALDFGDKAPGKAISYATKYALLKVFNIETGEDDESREEQKSGTTEKNKQEIQSALMLGQVIERSKSSIDVIQSAIATKNYQEGAEAWFELDNEVKSRLWVAPTKGGPFTSDERKVIQSKEWREAHYGPEVTEKEVKE